MFQSFRKDRKSNTNEVLSKEGEVAGSEQTSVAMSDVETTINVSRYVQYLFYRETAVFTNLI